MGQLKGALTDPGFQFIMSPEQALFGHLSAGDIFQGFNSADKAAFGIADQGGGKMEPAALLTQFGEKIRRFVGLINEARFGILIEIPLRNLMESIIQKKIRQAGPFPAVKGPPMLIGADDFFGMDLTQLLKGTVPINQFVVFSDNKSGDGRAADTALQEGQFFGKLSGNPVVFFHDYKSLYQKNKKGTSD